MPELSKLRLKLLVENCTVSFLPHEKRVKKQKLKNKNLTNDFITFN